MTHKLTEAEFIQLKPLEERTKGGRMIAEGEFGRCDVPTQNGRIYPRKIMEREIERLLPELKARGVVGELDHPCLTDTDWRVLSESGWTEFRDVKAGDKVWSLKDGVARLSEVKAIVDEPYDGDAYHVKGRSIDATFTPAHRFLLHNGPDAAFSEEKYVTTVDLASNPSKYSHSFVPKTATFDLPVAESVKIPGVVTKRPASAHGDVANPLVLDEKVYAAFIGIYLSEGSHVYKENDTYRVHISQKNEWSREYIRQEILSKFPSDVIWNESRDGFFASDARLCAHVDPLGDVYSKYVPDTAKNMSADALKEMIFWYIIGDGRMVFSDAKVHSEKADGVVGKTVLAERLRGGNIEKFTRQDLFSVSKRLVNDLHECVVKYGGSGSLSTVYPDKDYVFAGREIKAENKVPLYNMHLSHSKNIWMDQRFLSIEKVSHSGNIYCLTVDGGNFYMEKNGNSFWTGNCDGKNSLQRISHVLTSLRIEDDGRVMGRCEILDTPNGKILKAIVEGRVKVGVSSRGYGSTAPAAGKQEGEEVQEDFVLKTYDFVADPAMRTAIPEIKMESVEDDDQTVAEMFMTEFPEIAKALQEGQAVSCELTEGKDGKLKQTRKEIEEQVRKEMSESFERTLRDSIVELREDVSAELREEFENDPAAAGAKGILAAVAEMVGAYRQTPTEEAVQDALKAKELEVAEAQTERDQVAELAQTAAHALVVERLIGKHPMAKSIRKLLNGKTFESAEEAKKSVEQIIAELPDASEVVTKDEAKSREENAELRGNIALLESKVAEMTDRLSKAATLNERIDSQRLGEVEESNEKLAELQSQMEEIESKMGSAVQEAQADAKAAKVLQENAELKAYKLEKVVGNVNGRELLGLMESVQDRKVVDKLVENNGTQRMSDPNLEQMRRNLVKGQVSEKPLLEDSSGISTYSDVNELGDSMAEILQLSGIPSK